MKLFPDNFRKSSLSLKHSSQLSDFFSTISPDDKGKKTQTARAMFQSAILPNTVQASTGP